MSNPHDTVNIIIDKKHVTSPSATTGAALYVLGIVPAGYDLYREVHGHGDDELIPNNATPIELKNGDHLFSTKQSLNPGCCDGSRGR
jgi:hypothetical protein